MERLVGRVGDGMRMSWNPALLSMPSAVREGTKRRSRHVHVLAFAGISLVCVAGLAIVADLGAQQVSDSHTSVSSERYSVSEVGRRLEVTVVLSDSLSSDSPVILQRPGRKPATLIVLASAGATEAKLLEAIITLLTAREIGTDRLGGAARFRAKRGKVPALWSPSEVGRAGRVLTRLRAIEPEFLEGFGRVRYVVIHLREGALRGKLRQRGR